MSGTGIGTAVISATAGAVMAALPVTVAPSVTVVSSSAIGTLLGRSGAVCDAGTFVVTIAGTCTAGSPLPPLPALGSTSSPFTFTPIVSNVCAGPYAIAAINSSDMLAGYRGAGGTDLHAITWRPGSETQLGESPVMRGARTGAGMKSPVPVDGQNCPVAAPCSEL